MKYKVGDKVKIRSWSVMEQEFGLDLTGSIKIPRNFTKDMEDWCSKVVTIDQIHSGFYWVKENDFYWTDDMIDHVATRIMSIISRLEMLKKLTTDKNDHDLINRRIKNLKSNKPYFNNFYVNYYNDMFRKIKGKIK